jgi:hypothetical protein
MKPLNSKVSIQNRLLLTVFTKQIKSRKALLSLSLKHVFAEI